MNEFNKLLAKAQEGSADWNPGESIGDFVWEEPSNPFVWNKKTFAFGKFGDIKRTQQTPGRITPTTPPATPATPQQTPGRITPATPQAKPATPATPRPAVSQTPQEIRADISNYLNNTIWKTPELTEEPETPNTVADDIAKYLGY